MNFPKITWKECVELKEKKFPKILCSVNEKFYESREKVVEDLDELVKNKGNPNAIPKDIVYDIVEQFPKPPFLKKLKSDEARRLQLLEWAE
jgi:hypothetical protein